MTKKTPNFEEAFGEVLLHAALIYNAHNSVKGDSWKDLPIQDLYKKLLLEVAEYHHASDDHVKFVEAIDIVNFALMIASRMYLKSPYGPEGGAGAESRGTR